MRHNERGAALLVAIGVLTVLLVIAVTFYQMSRQEMRTATNYANGIQAELMAEGAISIATAFLNEDKKAHPTTTSTDHAWKSYFNGAWAVGKPWAWARTTEANPARDDIPLPIIDGGPPLIDIERIERDLARYQGLADNAGPEIEIGDLGQSLYIPRLEFDEVLHRQGLHVPLLFRDTADAYLSTASDIYGWFGGAAAVHPKYPFVVSTDLGTSGLTGPNGLGVLGNTLAGENPTALPLVRKSRTRNGLLTLSNNEELLPKEQIHFFSDVDNDGDGLNDSIWLPVAADRLFPNDGLDNDLDGFVDGEDLDGEPGIFMVSGAADGIDNDGDGEIDNEEEGEFAVHFTLPLDRMFQFWDENDEEWKPIGVVPSDLNYLPGANSVLTDNEDFDVDLAVLWLDDQPYQNYLNDPPSFRGKDSDFNGVINDGIDVSQFLLNRFARLNYNDPTNTELPSNFYFYQSLVNKLMAYIDRVDPIPIRILGEPASELVGRMAIHITDEASKVNVNAAGGLTFIEERAFQERDGGGAPLFLRDLRGIPMTQSISDGVGNHEYNLRVLPKVGEAIGDRMWSYRMGAQFGDNSPLNGGNALATTFSTGAIAPFAIPAPYQGTNTEPNPTLGFNGFAQNAYDISLPGYGFVDDNGNILQLAINGIDDDGDAVHYQWDGIDNNPLDTLDLLAENLLPDYNGDGNFDILDGIDEPGEGALVGTDEGLIPYDYDGDFDFSNPTNYNRLEYATLEGLDEPGEYRRYRPYRNRVAEQDHNQGDGVDGDFDGDIDEIDDGNNDGDGDGSNPVYDEIGELADGPYRTTQQIKNVDRVGQATFETLEPFVTAHSTDRNLRHNHRRDASQEDDISEWDGAHLREPTGIKLDYNFAAPDEIAQALVRDFNYAASVPRLYDTLGGETLSLDLNNTIDVETYNFARGLRREDASVFSRSFAANLQPANIGGTYYDTVLLEADAELRANQLAVNIRDFTDTNHSRSELTIKLNDFWMDGKLGQFFGASEMSYTQTGVEAIRINEIMVRPVRRFEAEANTELGELDPGYDIRFDPNRYGGFTTNDFDVRVRRLYDEINALNRISSIYRGNVNYENDDWNLRIAAEEVGTGVFEEYSYMGLQSTYAIYHNYLAVERHFPDKLDPVNNDPIIIDDNVPSLLQFSFRASDQLPAGRYYMTVNTDIIDTNSLANPRNQRVNTAPNYGDLQYAFYIGGENDSVIDQVMMRLDLESVDYDVFFQQVMETPAVLSKDVIGAPSGMAFMQAQGIYGPLNVGPPLTVDFHPTPGFTVTIPDDPNLYLHVAVARNKTDSLNAPPLAINYFEFSQEPDHEWVELINVNKDGPPVDLSNWLLRVEGEQPREMRIPEDTYIAPGGLLLLGTNKFDLFQAASGIYGTYGNSIYANGIGLARGDVINTASFTLDNVTVPPMFESNNPVFAPYLFDGQLVDYVDNDGDTEADLPPNMPSGARARPDDNVYSTVANATLEQIRPNKPFDRIVQLEIDGLFDLDTPQEIGRLVLQGGFFPNYPERDGVDNDGDRFLLARDGLDNDGDQWVDEAANFDDRGLLEGVDEGRNYRHPVDLSRPRAFSAPHAPPAPGTFSENFMLVYFDPDGDGFAQQTYPFGETMFGTTYDPPRWKEFVERRMFPGDNVILSLYEGSAIYGNKNLVDRVTYTEQDVVNAAIDDIVPVGDRAVPLNPYFPSFWPNDTMGLDFYKTLERKHPLYNGDRFGTQNRLQATDGNYDDWAESTGRYQRRIEYKADTRRWRFNLFNGIIDRFQTTSGIYSLANHAYNGSPLRMNMSQRLMENPPVPGSKTVNTVNPPPFDTVPSQFVEEGQFQFAGLPGSTVDHQWPFTKAEVRNNHIVSPGDLLTLSHFDRKEEMQGRSALNFLNENFLLDFSSPNQALAVELDNDPNTRETAYGDFHVNGILLGQTFANADLRSNDPAFEVDAATPNEHTLFAQTIDGSGNYGDALFMADHRDYSIDPTDNLSNDLHAVIANTASNDTLNLSVATASVLPLTEKTDFSNIAELPKTTWLFDSDPNSPFVPPSRWSPVVLFEMENDSTDINAFDQARPIGGLSYFYPYDELSTQAIAQLSNSPYPVRPLFVRPRESFLADSFMPRRTIPSVIHDVDRWPLERRAMFYASRNNRSITSFRDNSEADGRAGNEVIFIWDGNDGLENGEYDLYLGVNEDVSAIVDAHQAAANNTGDLFQLLTPFGTWFLNHAAQFDRFSDSVKMDMEVFTDKDGDGKVWRSDFNVPSSILDMNRGSGNGRNLPFVPESFDALLNTSPDVNGFINYGPVKIENNYLAVFLRNRSDSDIMARATRVVLAPRKKTPGRLNINTVVTDKVDDDGLRYFNPLIGLPGVAPGYNEFTGRYNFAANVNPAPPLIERDVGDPLNEEIYYVDYVNEIDGNDPPYYLESDSRRQSFAEFNTALHYRAQKIPRNRPEHPDGRYYQHITDLVRPVPIPVNAYTDVPIDIRSVTGHRQLVPISPDNFASLDDVVAQRHAYPAILSELTRNNVRDNDGDQFIEDENLGTPGDDDEDEIIENEESQRFDEIRERFRRLANMITTRSDVFEIRVKVQTGYVEDANDDGILNYRDDREFTPTAEKDARVIYER